MEPKTVQIIRITYAIIGALVGVSIFFTFGLIYNNWHCAGWGLASGVVATVVLVLHIQFLRNGLLEHATCLSTLLYTGVFLQVLTLAAFVTYIIIAVLQRQRVTPYAPGFYVTAVWTAMTFKWSFLLYWCSRKYRLHTVSSDVYQQI